MITFVNFPMLYKLDLDQSVLDVDGLLAKIVITMMEVFFDERDDYIRSNNI